MTATWRAPLALFLLATSAGAQTTLDLNARVAAECGPPHYGYASGCTIELGKGIYEIPATVQLGDCVTGRTRNSVTIRGQGAGLEANILRPDRYPVAATTLQWKGPAGAPMIESCGSWLTLEGMLLDAKGAGVAVRLMANNTLSAVNHASALRDLSIVSSTVAIEVVGSNYADMIDLLTIDRVSIQDVEICYLQDSSQAVANAFRTINCAARSRGFVLRGGSLTCDNCFVGQWAKADGRYDPAFIGFHATESARTGPPAFLAHHQMAVSHSHMELRAGRFVVGDVSGNPFPLSLVSNSFSIQCPAQDCEMLIVEWREKSPVLLQGNVIQASGTNQPRGRFCSTGGWSSTGDIRKPEVKELVWTCP